MLEIFLKIPPLKKILEFKDWKKTAKLILKTKKLKSEIKPMIENLKNELYQLENKQAKDAKLGATLLWLIFGKKAPQAHLIIIREWPKNNPLQLDRKE